MTAGTFIRALVVGVSVLVTPTPGDGGTMVHGEVVRSDAVARRGPYAGTTRR